MEAFKKRQVSFIVQLLLVTVVLFAIHAYLLYYIFDNVEFFFPTWHVYAFHAFITILFYTIINYRFSKDEKSIFNVFMILTFLKMVLAILFLLPLLLSDIENKHPDVFNFFIVYFSYLFFEVYALTRFLPKS